MAQRNPQWPSYITSCTSRGAQPEREHKEMFGHSAKSLRRSVKVVSMEGWWQSIDLASEGGSVCAPPVYVIGANSEGTIVLRCGVQVVLTTST